MNRGDIWTAQVAGKPRPVLLLTRDAVIDVRERVTVAEITTVIRSLGSEVEFAWSDVGLSRECVINCDGLHTVRKRDLVAKVGRIHDEELDRVCAALVYAIGC